MVITLDKVAKETALRCGDRNFERLKEIKGYVQDVVTELSMMLRGGGVYQTTTLTVSNSIATLPDGCIAVLRVYDNSTTQYEAVDNAEYRAREETSSTLPTVQVFEDLPNWRLRILNYNSGNTLSVDYLVVSQNPALMPDYYFYLLVSGAEARYHARRSTPDRFSIAAREYKSWKDQFLENRAYNERGGMRMKSLRELESAQPNNSLFINLRNDYLSPGGMY